MTTKKQQRQQEADAWMAANRHRIGIASELPGIKVQGRLFHPTTGDGWDNLTWRVQGKMRWSDRTGRWSVKPERQSSFSKTRGTTRYQTDEPRSYVSRCSQWLRTYVKEDTRVSPVVVSRLGNRSVFDAAFNFGLPCEPPGEWRDGYNARRQAEAEVSRGGLKTTAILFGQRLPFDLSIQKRKEWSARTLRNQRVWSFQELLSDDDMNPEDMFADMRQVELIEMEELRELLRSYLTGKEMEALDERASGVAVTDRHCLKRAQRKAQEALQM